MALSNSNHYGILSDSLVGKVALVTGGSRGIGNATCIALAAKGATIAVHYRSQAEIAQAVVAQIADMGGQAVALQADLVDPDAPGQLVADVIAQLGRVDILVNNAGVMTRSAVAELSDALWDETLALNLTATFKCARACIPGMKERQWGRIINVTSQVAARGSANHAHYAASKSALSGFNYSLAREVSPFGITVNLVAPGRIVTDLLVDAAPGREEEWKSQTPARRLGNPEEVAAPIAFLASDAAAYITEATLHVNGGLHMS